MKIKRGVRRAPVSFTELTFPSLITVAILALAGCSAGAGGGGNISVTINNKVTSVQAGTAAISFSATVQNDSSNKGVTWSLTASGASCSPTCGALSAATSTSVTYTPPASAGASPNNQPTLTATSVAKTNKSDTDTFTINPALTVTITNKVSTVNAGTLPFVVNATVQNDPTNSGVSWSLTANGAACTVACGTLTGATTSSVTYTPPSTVPSSPNITLTATSVHDNSKSDSDGFTIVKPALSVTIGNKVSTVYADGSAILFSVNVDNDPTNSGVTWKLTASGSGCSPGCGTITGGQSSAIYMPPISVPNPATATLTAVSIADGTKSDFDTFTIASHPPVSVTVSQITSVLAGGSGITFSANIQNDPSSIPTVNWMLSVGGTSCATSTCGKLTNPQPTSVTYVPPSGAEASVQITATSTYDPTKSGSDVFNVTSSVSSGCGAAGGYESLLTGHYAMLVQGFWGSGSGTPILIAASFAANGGGTITGGEEDVNDTISPQHLTFDSAPGRSLYTVGADHRGCLQLTNSGGATTVFRFSLGGISSGVASKGRIIEFDDNSGTGARYRGSGIIRLQDTTAFMAGALKPNYAFGVGGWTQSGNQWLHLGAAGSFSNSGGSLTGVLDENIGGILFPETTGVMGDISGISSTTGRAVANFPLGVFDWAMYIVNSSEFFLIGTDAVNDNPVSFGTVIATGNSFTASALSGNYILHATGNASGGASVDLDLLTTTPGGGQTGTLSGTVYSDGGGNGAATTSLSNVAYNIDSTLGRVALGNPSNNLPVLYVTTPTDGISAFVLGVNADAQEGVIEFQPSQTYSTASVAGTFSFGTEDPGDNTVYNDAGSATITSSGSASGTVDLSTTGGLTPSVPFSATLTISNSNGTGNLGSQTVAITNGTKLFYIDESTGVIVVAEQ